MLKRRFHIAGSRRRSKARLNRKYDLKRRARVSAEIQQDWQEMEERPNPMLYVPQTDIELDPNNDLSFFTIRNIGGAPMMYNIHSWPDWVDVVTTSDAMMVDDQNYGSQKLMMGEFHNVWIKAREGALPQGVTSGSFEVMSTGGTAVINVSTISAKSGGSVGSSVYASSKAFISSPSKSKNQKYDNKY